MEHRKIALMFCFIPKTDLGAGLVLHLTLADRRISQADSPKNRKEAPKIDTAPARHVLGFVLRCFGCVKLWICSQAEMCSTLAETPKAAKAQDLQEASPEGMVLFFVSFGCFIGLNICSNLWNFRSAVGSNSEC